MFASIFLTAFREDDLRHRPRLLLRIIEARKARGNRGLTGFGPRGFLLCFHISGHPLANRYRPQGKTGSALRRDMAVDMEKQRVSLVGVKCAWNRRRPGQLSAKPPLHLLCPRSLLHRSRLKKRPSGRRSSPSRNPLRHLLHYRLSPRRSAGRAAWWDRMANTVRAQGKRPR